MTARSRYSSALVAGFSSIAHAYAHLAVLLYATLVLALEHDWPGGYAELFALGIPMTIMFGVGAFPAGWLADRWSQTGMIAIFFVGTGAAAILAGLAQTPLALGFALTLIGTFASIYHPVGVPWLVKGAINPGRALGLNGVFGSLGTAAASLVAGALVAYHGWRAGFLVPGAVMVLTGVAFIAALRLGLMIDKPAAQKPTHAPTSAADIRRVFLVLSITMLCAGLCFQMTSFALPKLFEERLGAALDGNVLGIGGMVTLVYVLAGLAQIVGGELSDRLSTRNVYLTSIMLQVPVMVAAYWMMGPELVGAAALIAALNGAGQPAENSLLARFSPPSWQGRAFGAKFVLTLGVSAAGVAIIPLVHRLTGNLDMLLLILAAVAAVASIAGLFLPQTGRRTPAQKALPAE